MRIVVQGKQPPPHGERSLVELFRPRIVTSFTVRPPQFAQCQGDQQVPFGKGLSISVLIACQCFVKILEGDVVASLSTLEASQVPPHERQFIMPVRIFRFWKLSDGNLMCLGKKLSRSGVVPLTLQHISPGGIGRHQLAVTTRIVVCRIQSLTHQHRFSI